MSALLTCTLRATDVGVEVGPLSLLLTANQPDGHGGGGEEGKAAAAAAYIPLWMALIDGSDVPKVGSLCLLLANRLDPAQHLPRPCRRICRGATPPVQGNACTSRSSESS